MIQVGQVLDKYELLERVGQGGMAIVYRGIDRQLKRTVAIKILHKHLSDYQEARDRFEREAQAVAKLRHENILEIFDYSAKAGAESYIVTEFIEGLTLKQFFTERPIGYPEVGAMIMLQVARALAHAHAAGILHRDVKPENIMIRSDGVVKLMDFGISHMVDLERLTVTGQLLGSPAYMAPEHVEGRPLDFRTDVFAVGIVLYQLTVGKLPFEGKNPHEVLKRIAECKFVDPRVANPRIGNRLGRIILRAMALMPSDRYPAIGEMVLALEAYLVESGIEPDKLTSELARYFKAPVPYEQALKERLVDHLTRRGQKLLADGEQTPALDVFDRVLTIDPQNAKVLAILDGLNRRARLKTAGLALLAVSVISAGGYAIHKKSQRPPPEPPPDPTVAMSPMINVPSTNVTRVESPPEDIDAGVAVAVVPDGNGGVVRPNNPDVTPNDAAVAVVPIRTLRIQVQPAKDSEVRFGDEATWAPILPETDDVSRPSPDRETRVYVRNRCCQEQDKLVPAGATDISFQLQALAAKVTPMCELPGTVVVTINDRPATLGKEFPESFPKNTTQFSKRFKIEFTGERIDSTPIEIRVDAGDTQRVQCVAR